MQGNRFLQGRVPGWLDTEVASRLNDVAGQVGGYHYSGLEAVEEALANIPLVKKYLA